MHNLLKITRAFLSLRDALSKKNRNHQSGIGDLVLPSAYIFIALYYPLVLLTRNISEQFAPWIAIVAYPIILLVLYFFKSRYLRNNGNFLCIGIVDDNVGSRFIDISIVIVAISLIVLAIIGYVSCLFLPVLIVSLVGVIVNSLFFKYIRDIKDPYKSWDGSWHRRNFNPLPQGVDNFIDIHFSWVDILAIKGVKGDEKLDCFTIKFQKSDFEGNSPRVRECNPFFLPGLQYEDDRERLTNIVLDGADKTLQNIGETECFEDRSLSQIINSAYDICKRYNLADFEMFDLILMFCQKNIEYKVDKECDSINRIGEYYRFASETLYDRTGDCDCKAVLAYKLFELLGVDPQFVIVKANNEDAYNHAAIVLRNDIGVGLPPRYKEYKQGMGVYCEATANGDMHPGDIPEGVDLESMKFVNRSHIGK